MRWEDTYWWECVWDFIVTVVNNVGLGSRAGGIVLHTWKGPMSFKTPAICTLPSELCEKIQISQESHEFTDVFEITKAFFKREEKALRKHTFLTLHVAVFLSVLKESKSVNDSVDTKFIHQSLNEIIRELTNYFRNHICSLKIFNPEGEHGFLIPIWFVNSSLCGSALLLLSI